MRALNPTQEGLQCFAFTPRCRCALNETTVVSTERTRIKKWRIRLRRNENLQLVHLLHWEFLTHDALISFQKKFRLDTQLYLERRGCEEYGNAESDQRKSSELEPRWNYLAVSIPKCCIQRISSQINRHWTTFYHWFAHTCPHGIPGDGDGYAVSGKVRMCFDEIYMQQQNCSVLCKLNRRLFIHKRKQHSCRGHNSDFLQPLSWAVIRSMMIETDDRFGITGVSRIRKIMLIRKAFVFYALCFLLVAYSGLHNSQTMVRLRSTQFVLNPEVPNGSLSRKESVSDNTNDCLEPAEMLLATKYRSVVSHSQGEWTHRWKSSFWLQAEWDFSPWIHDGISLKGIMAQRKRAGAKVVLVEDGVVTVNGHQNNRSETDREMKCLRQLRDLLNFVRLPNILFLMRTGSRPQNNSNARLDAPVLAMAKSHEFRDIVLYPNPYFTHYLEIRDSLLNSSQFPWEQRKTIAFWRGQCYHYPGSMPRVELVSQLQSSDLADVALTGMCRMGTWPSAQTHIVEDLRYTDRVSYHHMATFKYVVAHVAALGVSLSRYYFVAQVSNRNAWWYVRLVLQSYAVLRLTRLCHSSLEKSVFWVLLS